MQPEVLAYKATYIKKHAICNVSEHIQNNNRLTNRIHGMLDLQYSKVRW